MLPIALWNKLMHIKNGNHGPTKSWYHQNQLAPDSCFSFGTLNIGGLQEAVKRQRIINLDHDIFVMTETHLQNHLEYSESQQLKDYYCFWGCNPGDKHFSGVGILIKRSKFWSAQELKWTSEHPCFPFAQDGRLIAVQAWYARGGTALTMYGMYGQSGARWERTKRAYVHDLI